MGYRFCELETTELIEPWIDELYCLKNASTTQETNRLLAERRAEWSGFICSQPQQREKPPGRNRAPATKLGLLTNTTRSNSSVGVPGCAPFAVADEEGKQVGLPCCVPFAVAEAADGEAEQIARKREKSRRGWEGEESAKANKREKEEHKAGTQGIRRCSRSEQRWSCPLDRECTV